MTRSLLYVPAHSERFIAKAHERDADAIVLDLEDGVPEPDKDAARNALPDTIASAGRSGAKMFVRVNLGERCAADCEAAARARAFGLFIPKVHSAKMLVAIGAALDHVEREVKREPVRFVPMIEDPGAVFEARAIAASTPRVYGVVVGGEDLATAIGSAAMCDSIRHAILTVHLAAKAAGALSFGLLRSIADYSDLDGVRAAAHEARTLGFDGASCVHPAVVPILNEAFAPSAAEIDHAGRLIAAADAAAAQGLGAFAFEGKMVDPPVVQRARNLLARSRELKL